MVHQKVAVRIIVQLGKHLRRGAPRLFELKSSSFRGFKMVGQLNISFGVPFILAAA